MNNSSSFALRNKSFTIFLFSVLSLAGFNAIGQKTYADSLSKDEVRRIDSLKRYEDSQKLAAQFDFGDLLRDILHSKPPDPLKKKSGVTIIPNIASNPTIGFQGGIKAVAGRKFGLDSTTLMSIAASSASITTKGIIYFYISHNVYTSGNKWNLQGSLVVSKSVTPDFGLGIGKGAYDTEEERILTNPQRKGYVLHSFYYRFNEKVYKEVRKNLFLGAGVGFEIRRKLEDRISSPEQLTPYRVYNAKYGFSPDHYASNGLLFNAQYTTRDNQNRAYKGMYADAGFRFNETWLGSSRSAVQFTVDVRKYFSLSDSHPEHVIALWNWGSWLISGELPYFEIPGSGKDVNSRSGRGYTVAYFKGTQYDYSEIEYRFPITRNKFLSGVAFVSLQSANDDAGTKLFQQFQPGAGGGLRVLFNKATRTNLCLDYAFGKYGSKGFFLGLNEAF